MSFTITKSCPQCERVYAPDLCKLPDFEERFQRWRRRGVLIQNAFPESTPIQRVQLNSGICSQECWDALHGEGSE